MSTERDGEHVDRTELVVEGATPVRIPADAPPETLEWPTHHRTVGFECASGEWIERDWVGIPLFELLDAAAVPDETTHVQIEGRADERAVVSLADLEGPIIAIGGGADRPRFVSEGLYGPRAIKNVATVRPLALAPDERPEDYENLPLALD